MRNIWASDPESEVDEEEEEGEGDEEVDADEEDDEMLDIVKPTLLHTRYSQAGALMSMQGHHNVQMTTLNVQHSPHIGAAACSRCLQSDCCNALNWRRALAVDSHLHTCSVFVVTGQGLHPQANDEHGSVATEEPPGQGSLGEASISHGMRINLEGVEDGAQPDLSALGNWASAEPWEAPLLPREQRTRRPRSDRGEGRLEALAGMVASGGALAEEAGVHWGAGMPERAVGQQPGLRTLEHRSMAFLQHLRQYTQALHASEKFLFLRYMSKRQWLGCNCLIGKSQRPYPA